MWNQWIQKYQAEKTDPVKCALENNVNIKCCPNVGYSVSLEDLTDAKKMLHLSGINVIPKDFKYFTETVAWNVNKTLNCK